MKISPKRDWILGFIIIGIYTLGIIWMTTLPLTKKLMGWVTPDKGVVIKTSDGYVSIANGEILDFGKGVKVRVTFEDVNGEVAQ